MRKVLLPTICIIALSVTFMNANAIEKENSLVNYEDDYSCVTDCNWFAREMALLESEDQEDRGPGGELMENYNFYFNQCMNGCDA